MDEGDLREIEKKEWIKTVTRSFHPCFHMYQAKGERDFLAEKVGSGLRNEVLLPAKGGHTQFLGKVDWKKFAQAINKRVKERREWLQNLADDIYSFGKEYVGYSKKIFNTDLKKASSEDLLNYFDNFGNMRVKLAYSLLPPLVVDGIIKQRTKDKLKEALKEKGKVQEFDRYWDVITTKVTPNEADKEEIELLKIAKEYQEKGELSEGLHEELEAHTRKYAWVPYYGLTHPTWDKEHFEEKIREIEKPRETLKESRKAKEENKENLEEVKREFKNTDLEEWIELIQTYLHLRPYRTEVLRKTRYHITPLLREIAKRMKEDYEDVICLAPEEIKKFLAKGVKPKSSEIQARKEDFAVVMVDGKIDLVSKQEKIKKLEKILLGENEETSLLEGNSAYEGKAEGEVKIIESIEDSDKFKEGDVLVSSMTTPEMTSLVKKASAIVTDEGGLTCHAAVISRELEVPCVIGTKKASKVLKDGEEVEVNAEEGIVKKVK